MKPALDFSVLDALTNKKPPTFAPIEQLSLEWEQERQAAIEKSIFSGSASTTNEYDWRIKKCFQEAYKFINDNKHPLADADWERIVGSLSPYTDPFTSALVVACIDEMERDYQQTTEEK